MSCNKKVTPAALSEESRASEVVYSEDDAELVALATADIGLFAPTTDGRHLRDMTRLTVGELARIRSAERDAGVRIINHPYYNLLVERLRSLVERHKGLGIEKLQRLGRSAAAAYQKEWDARQKALSDPELLGVIRPDYEYTKLKPARDFVTRMKFGIDPGDTAALFDACHAVDRHAGKSLEYLAARNIPFSSTFDDVETMCDAVVSAFDDRAVRTRLRAQECLAESVRGGGWRVGEEFPEARITFGVRFDGPVGTGVADDGRVVTGLTHVAVAAIFMKCEDGPRRWVVITAYPCERFGGDVKAVFDVRLRRYA